MIPLILIAAIAAVAVSATGEKKGDKKGGGELPPTKGGSIAETCPLDANLPAEQQAQVRAFLVSQLDPAILEQAAVAAEAQGQPLVATCARARAAELRAQGGSTPPSTQPGTTPPPGPTPPSSPSVKPPECALDSVLAMNPILKAQFDALVAQAQVPMDPGQAATFATGLDTAAANFELAGAKVAASCLRLWADYLRKKAAGGPKTIFAPEAVRPYVPSGPIASESFSQKEYASSSSKSYKTPEEYGNRPFEE